MPVPSKSFLSSISRSIYILSSSPHLLHPQRSCFLAHSFPYARSISSSPGQDENLEPQFTNPSPRTRTPLEKQFETWVQKLKPGFTPYDVDEALRAQSDPDLALDIFRWTAQQRGYKHNNVTYLTMIKQLTAGRRYRQAETLVEEVIAENVEVRGLSMTKQMKASGVIPDTFVLNMIIKAYAKCLEVDEAIRVVREMGLYGCEPNAYTYGYIAKGLCEKGRVNQGLGFFKEMRSKCLVPSTSTYVIIICSLALDRRFEDAIEIVFDMLDNSRSPDHLTYKTVLEGLCREGRGNEAFELLDQWRNRDVSMNDKAYKILLNGLHFLSRE
ncbi:hypothetical protein K1719_006572 [Acacia pycnantha]|nr:hypothetical protein K1719_006572 [Acacia pycnantha]